MDFEMVKAGADSAATLSTAVTGALRPSPVTVTVLSMLPPAAGLAKLLARACYTRTASPLPGTLIPLTISGGPAVTAGVGCSTPFANKTAESAS